MKILCLFCFILILITPTSIQSQTIDSALSYYPLEVGNIWEYTYQYPGLYQLFSVSVVKDTLLSNGKRYKELLRNQLPNGPVQYSFMRIDSSNANLYAYDSSALGGEHFVDSLRLGVGDTSLRYGPLSRIDTASVLGFVTSVRVFFRIVGGNGYFVAYGIGLYHAYEVGPMEYPYLTDLVYARIGGREYGTLLSVGKDTPRDPRDFQLQQNYPNPFNPSTRISFSLPNREFVTLKVFDLLGRQVSALINEIMNSGFHSILFDGRNLSSGFYVYRIEAGDHTASKAMLLLK